MNVLQSLCFTKYVCKYFPEAVIENACTSKTKIQQLQDKKKQRKDLKYPHTVINAPEIILLSQCFHLKEAFVRYNTRHKCIRCIIRGRYDCQVRRCRVRLTLHKRALLCCGCNSLILPDSSEGGMERKKNFLFELERNHVFLNTSMEKMQDKRLLETIETVRAIYKGLVFSLKIC